MSGTEPPTAGAEEIATHESETDGEGALSGSGDDLDLPEPVHPDPNSRRSQKKRQRAEQAEQTKLLWKAKRAKVHDGSQEGQDAVAGIGALSPSTATCGGVEAATALLEMGQGAPSPPGVDAAIEPEKNLEASADPEETRRNRAARKAAEIVDFQERCEAGTTIVLDLEWEDKMTDRELKSLAQQLLYCYGANRQAKHPARLVLTGVTKDGKMHKRLKNIAGFDSWFIRVSDEKYVDLFERDKLVYLTADAEEVVTSFDPQKAYVIGGIVDRNRLKGKTKEKADKQGIASGRLPIGEYIDMGSHSRVLTTNHVVSIVVEHQASGDWRHVLGKCVPGRHQFLDSVAGEGEDAAAASGAPADPSGDGPASTARSVAGEGGDAADGSGQPLRKHGSGLAKSSTRAQRKNARKAKGKERWGPRNGPQQRPGDWMCPNLECAELQFARNAVCRKCGAVKPPTAELDAGLAEDNADDVAADSASGDDDMDGRQPDARAAGASGEAGVEDATLASGTDTVDRTAD